jgi:hypothetical protein
VKSAEPAQYGIDDGGGHVGAHRRGDQLADEIGVSIAQREDLIRVQGAAGDEFAYGGLGETLWA